MTTSDDDRFVRSAGQAARVLRKVAIAAWAITALLLAGIGILAFFAAETFGIMIPWMFIAWLMPLGGSVIVTMLAYSWSATEKSATKKIAEGKSTIRLQLVLLVGVILAALYFMRDVLLSAFTDGPGPNDTTEFLIGAGVLGGLVIAVINGLRPYKKGRPPSAKALENVQSAAQHPDDAARRTFQRLLVVVVAAFVVATVYVMSVQVR